MPRRYRCEAGSTSRARTRFHHISKLGKIKQIRGYRFLATRTETSSCGSKQVWTTTYERVLVKGEHGTARFDGLCWGYSGEGPRGLKELLLACGCHEDVANQAFTFPRQDKLGTDWSITMDMTMNEYLAETSR